MGKEMWPSLKTE